MPNERERPVKPGDPLVAPLMEAAKRLWEEAGHLSRNTTRDDADSGANQLYWAGNALVNAAGQEVRVATIGLGAVFGAIVGLDPDPSELLNLFLEQAELSMMEAAERRREFG